MRSLRKTAMFSEGQRTEGHFRYPGASNAITIIVDLRSEHDLKVLLKVGHADSATNMQVIGLTHRPNGVQLRIYGLTSTILSGAGAPIGRNDRPIRVSEWRFPFLPARPSPRIDACVPHYNISGKTSVLDGVAALPPQQ